MLLNQIAVNSPFDATPQNANWTLVENSFLDLGHYIISGLVPSAGTGLSVSIALGTASIGGRVTAAAPFTIAGLTDNTVNHLWILNSGAGTSNTTGTAPANSAKLGTATTAGGVVTSVNTGRTSGRQQFLQPQALIPGGAAAGLSSAGQPDALNLNSWNLTDIEGKSFYGVLPAGAVTSGSLPADVAYTDAANTFLTTLAAGPQTLQVNDAGASATVSVLRLRHGTSAGPANFIGTQIDLQAPNSTPAFVNAASIYGQLSTVTAGAENGTMAFIVPLAGVQTEGLKLQPNGAKLQVRVVDEFRHIGATFAAFNSVPVVQPSSTTDIRLALISLGFLASGGASPMNLNGGALTAGVTALGATTVTGSHTVVGTQTVQALCPATRIVSATGTINTSDFALYVNATGGAITLTLPQASTVPGMLVAIKKTDVSANAVTIAAHAGDTTEGAASVVITGGLATVWLQSLGTTVWYLLKQ